MLFSQWKAGATRNKAAGINRQFILFRQGERYRESHKTKADPYLKSVRVEARQRQSKLRFAAFKQTRNPMALKLKY